MYKFSIMVYVQRRPHMRDPNIEYLLHFGQSVLRQIFDEERVDPSITSLTLYFPERWMNIIEERSLFVRLAKFCPNLEKLEIMTQSVYIIQSVSNQSVRILTSQDERDRIHDEGRLTQESDTGRLWACQLR